MSMTGVCDLCGERPSSIRFTEIKDDIKTEMNLCEACAETRGLGLSPAAGKAEYGIGELIAGMFDEAAQAEAVQDLVCSRCGLTYAEFKQIGRLGCPQCYESFSTLIAPLLSRIHGKARHLGKSPARTGGLLGRRTALRERRAALRTAVEREDFEEAARLRDECRALEEELRAGRRGPHEETER